MAEGAHLKCTRRNKQAIIESYQSTETRTQNLLLIISKHINHIEEKFGPGLTTELAANIGNLIQIIDQLHLGSEGLQTELEILIDQAEQFQNLFEIEKSKSSQLQLELTELAEVEPISPLPYSHTLIQNLKDKLNQSQQELTATRNKLITLQRFRSDTAPTMLQQTENTALISSVTPFSAEDESRTINQYLTEIEMLGDIGNWVDKTKKTVAIFKLSGRAAEFATRQNLASLTSFAEVKQTLVNAFGKLTTTSQLLDQSTKLKIKPHETVPEFGARVREACIKLYIALGIDSKKLPPRAEAQITATFMDGLNEPLRQFMLIKDPQSLETAIAEATKYLIKNSPPEKPTTESSLQSQLDNLTSELVKLKVQSESNVCAVNPSPKLIKCQLCGKNNHTAPECYRLRQFRRPQQQYRPFNFRQQNRQPMNYQRPRPQYN